MNTLRGKWVFDSNILVYSQDSKSPFYQKANRLFSQILSGDIKPVVAQQNIIETERVLTQVYKQDPAEIVRLLEDIIFNFHIIVITPLSTTYERYHSLLLKADRPNDLFDFYLAATMLDNEIDRILTVNDKDFSQIKEIEAINPLTSV